METKLKNLSIGLFFICGFMLIAFFTWFIKPNTGDGKQLIFVRFSNISGIKIGTYITFAGKIVGEISNISNLKNARFDSVDKEGDVFPYLLTLKIDSRTQVYTTDEINIDTKGLLGEKFITINPRPLKKGVTPIPVTKASIVYSDSNDFVETTIEEIENLSKQMTNVLEYITHWLNTHGENLGDLIHDVSIIAQEAQLLLKTINKEEILLDIQNICKSSTELFNELDRFVEQLVDEKGSIGQLITNNDLYIQSLSLLKKCNILLNNINQYGLTFQYNKTWQRRENANQS